MNISSILNVIPHKTAFAHCDIPCGIYDVHQVQMAAHTIIRMTEFLGQVKREDLSIDSTLLETKAEHDIARIVHVKEEHSNILEHELSTLQDDYFKNDYSKFPEVVDLFKKAKEFVVRSRTGIDLESAKENLEIIMQIAEVFYRSKGLEFKRVKSPYPTGLDIVVQG